MVIIKEPIKRFKCPVCKETTPYDLYGTTRRMNMPVFKCKKCGALFGD